MASRLKEMFPGASILDYGCAKGFLVKALRMLDVQAWGFDTSNYAITNADKDAKNFVSTDLEDIPPVDAVFCKDTLEHVDKSNIVSVISSIRLKSRKAFVIVPLGDHGRYRIPVYHEDKTHLIAENEAWWHNRFNAALFNVEDFSYHVKGFKDNWSEFDTGNGFFFLS